MVLDVMMPGIDGFDFAPAPSASGRDPAGAVPDRARRGRGPGPRAAPRRRRLPDQTVQRGRGDRTAGEPAASRVRTPTPPRRGSRRAVLRCGDLEVDERPAPDPPRRTGIDLSPTEFRLLAYLLLHQGRVLSKAQILEQLWQYDFSGDSNVVERFVSNLRRKIDVLIRRPHPHRAGVRLHDPGTRNRMSPKSG